MKKVCSCTALLLCFSLILCAAASCAKQGAQPTVTETDPALTSPYGDPIPVYSDVSLSTLDPALFVLQDNGRYVYADEAVETYAGIDVSTFQGDVDWEAVKADGIDFVMLRIGYRGYGTEGKLCEDDRFSVNFSAASAAGLKIGVYFFSQAITPAEAKEEADFVLDRVKGLKLDYPIAYDWEAIDYDSARTDGLSSVEISACAAAFCDRIASKGYDALIYFNRELGYFNYDLSLVKDYHFWLAEYLDKPSFVYDYKMWQYTRNGSVAGIEGNVDLNICVYQYGGAR